MSGADRPFRVALTFDTEHPDRPSAPGIETGLLDLLEREHVRATFFIQGRWAEAWPDLARRIAAAGHRIGSHSHYHARMPMLSQRGLRSDIALAERAILDATGIDPKPYFRCPFGAGQADARVQAVLRAAGYQHVGWHVVGTDWPPERTAAAVERSVVDGVLAHGDGAVVLLHGWPDRMLGAMLGVIPGLRSEGATFVGIDELERLPTVGGEVPESAEAS